jgi:hypothetical protein
VRDCRQLRLIEAFVPPQFEHMNDSKPANVGDGLDAPFAA